MPIAFLLSCLLSACSSSGGSASNVTSPGKLRFADDEEKRIVMEGAAVGAGLGLGLGFGLGGNRNSTIGLGTIGGLLGGAVGKKQASDIRKLKLKSKELEKLISAANRRTAEVRQYNLKLERAIAADSQQAAAIAANVAARRKLHDQARASLVELDDRITYLDAARTKSALGRESTDLQLAGNGLKEERDALANNTARLAAGQ